MLNELKSCFLEAYDDNQDGKIDIRELAQLLPMEENFLLLFRFDNPLESSVEFMKIWREYDSDNSGYIEADELKVRHQIYPELPVTVAINFVFSFFSKEFPS